MAVTIGGAEEGVGPKDCEKESSVFDSNVRPRASCWHMALIVSDGWRSPTGELSGIGLTGLLGLLNSEDSRDMDRCCLSRLDGRSVIRKDSCRLNGDV